MCGWPGIVIYNKFQWDFFKWCSEWEYITVVYRHLYLKHFAFFFGCWCTSELFTSIPAESFWFSIENHHKRTTYFHREHYQWNVARPYHMEVVTPFNPLAHKWERKYYQTCWYKIQLNALPWEEILINRIFTFTQLHASWCLQWLRSRQKIYIVHCCS